jgi:pantothenate synthetase
MKDSYERLKIYERNKLLEIGNTNLSRFKDKLFVEYISIANMSGLEINEIIKGQTMISLAVKIGKTRLIDNIIL